MIRFRETVPMISVATGLKDRQAGRSPELTPKGRKRGKEEKGGRADYWMTLMTSIRTDVSDTGVNPRGLGGARIVGVAVAPVTRSKGGLTVLLYAV